MRGFNGRCRLVEGAKVFLGKRRGVEKILRLFGEQMEWLRANVRVAPLAEVVVALAEWKPLPERTVALTSRRKTGSTKRFGRRGTPASGLRGTAAGPATPARGTRRRGINFSADAIAPLRQVSSGGNGLAAFRPQGAGRNRLNLKSKKSAEAVTIR